MNVGERNVREVRRAGRRECFDAIANDENDVGHQFRKRLRKAGGRDAGGGGVVGGAFASLPRHGRIDAPTFLANRVNAAAVRAVEVHPSDDKLKADFRMPLDRPKRRAHQPKFGAGAGDEADGLGRVTCHWLLVTRSMTAEWIVLARSWLAGAHPLCTS
jgi:hypothetical protein